MNLIVTIGLIAAVLTTFAQVPQAIKAWKTKSTKDVSFLMFLLLTTGVVLWFIYGILIMSWPLILANALTGITAGTTLVLKIKYK